ncbi:hypothetical protein SPHINGO391_390044 [Sphingomonas aurantiaca]|uniref:Uncharacterized protein n=1 Tax=Sphingomonas aurantiaca TaxID=185949 RepID=A0A5E7YM33_9SPHN|nr:hypothetical protein [Sphingomonas aurantiaca]VVT07382.1 hypothetical protein SPHINGO391_390044 [Sphingomonas aurantiaca]
MAKALRTAAFVVGAAALVVSGAGALAGAGLFATTLGSGAVVAGVAGISATGLTAIGAGLAAAAGALSFAAGTPKGTIGGSATQFKIDKDSGIPIIIGRSPPAYRILRRVAAAAREIEWWPTALARYPV